MMKLYCIIPLVLIGTYLVLVLPSVPKFLESRRLDSGMSYSEFARPFKVIDSDWTEERVLDAFGKPDKIEEEGDIRRLSYRWANIDFTWLLETPSTQGGGVSIHFRNGKMFATGWSDSTDEEIQQPDAEVQSEGAPSD